MKNFLCIIKNTTTYDDDDIKSERGRKDQKEEDKEEGFCKQQKALQPALEL